MDIDPKLKDFASDRVFQYIHAVERCEGNVTQAAIMLGISEGTIKEAIRCLKIDAAARGYAPEHDLVHPTAEGRLAGGVSTMYKDGKPRIQWVKDKLDMEKRRQLVRSMVGSLLNEAHGRSRLVEPPRIHDSQLMTVIPVGDPHFGLQVWGAECGAPFDLKLARNITHNAVDSLMARTPSSSVCTIILLGDTFHMNDHSNQTPRSRHPLDVDGRFGKVLQIAIETYKHAIMRALERHKTVVVRVVRGNHDPEASWALSVALHAFFANDQRVKVDLHPSEYWYYRFGKVLIGSTHGHTIKHEKLGGIMAEDRPRDWGMTRYRYWYTGHVHSKNVTELPGVVCESFRTLAAADSFANSHGYRSGRDLVGIVHHKEFGEWDRHRVDIYNIQKLPKK